MQEARPKGTQIIGLHLYNTREDAQSMRDKADQCYLGKRGWKGARWTDCQGMWNYFVGGEWTWSLSWLWWWFQVLKLRKQPSLNMCSLLYVNHTSSCLKESGSVRARARKKRTGPCTRRGPLTLSCWLVLHVYTHFFGPAMRFAGS